MTKKKKGLEIMATFLKAKKISHSIRIPVDLSKKVEDKARTEYRTFSATVTMLLDKALKYEKEEV